MKRPPLAAIRLSLVLVLLALALAAIGLLWSHSAARNAEATLARAQAAQAAAAHKLARSRDEQRLVATYLGDYEALIGAGFIGEEDRLAWVEAVQLAARTTGLPGLEYRLQPRTSASAALGKGLALRQTTMTLGMPLLIETDLPRFFAALRARAPGIYHVQGCRMARTSQEPFAPINEPRLKAECELLWFTLPPSPGASAS